MTISLYLLIWLLPSMLISIGIGAHVGYSLALRRHAEQISQEREQTLQALVTIVESAEELTTEVDTHNTELKSVERSVCDLSTQGEYEEVKEALLHQIAAVMESNRSLEHDLVCTRFRLEEVAQELDRTRLEARVDELSGVGNRKAFDESLQYMFSFFKRHQASFALLLIDVDHFKWINDTHGHPSGDVVVQRLGACLKEVIRGGDHVARYGGDEFALLLSRVQEEGAMNIASADSPQSRDDQFWCGSRRCPRRRDTQHGTGRLRTRRYPGIADEEIGRGPVSLETGGPQPVDRVPTGYVLGVGRAAHGAGRSRSRRGSAASGVAGRWPISRPAGHQQPVGNGPLAADFFFPRHAAALGASLPLHANAAFSGFWGTIASVTVCRVFLPAGGSSGVGELAPRLGRFDIGRGRFRRTIGAL